MNELALIYSLLFDTYGPQGWWPASSPFEMMAGAILTQNTAWANVERAIANFRGRLTPRLILEMEHSELIEIIRPAGFFNQKAARLKNLAAWYRGYRFDIDRLRRENPEKIRRELLGINGIGYETAYSIMLYALDMPVFVIDAYTVRIFTRLGFILPKDYDGRRLLFENALPRDVALYKEFHALIVRLAKTHCRNKPRCAGCPLFNRCVYAKCEIDSRKKM